MGYSNYCDQCSARLRVFSREGDEARNIMTDIGMRVMVENVARPNSAGGIVTGTGGWGYDFCGWTCLALWAERQSLEAKVAER